MYAISPTAVQTCLVVLQAVGLVGVWLMRICERTEFADSLRGLVMLTMVLLGLTITVSLSIHPRSGLSAGAVLATIAVLAVVDFRKASAR